MHSILNVHTRQVMVLKHLHLFLWLAYLALQTHPTGAATDWQTIRKTAFQAAKGCEQLAALIDGKLTHLRRALMPRHSF